MPATPGTETGVEVYDPLCLPEYEVDQYVVPLLTRLPDGSLKLHGTAFFINSSGIFLTAGHVVTAAYAEASANNGTPCLAIRIPENSQGITYDILATDVAPAPFDVGVGITNKASKSFVRLANATAGLPLRDVMTFGYPESAQTKAPAGDIILGCRAYKGYIIRKLGAGQVLLHPHPPAFQLDFPVPSALSGAPLVLERPATPIEHALMAAPGLVPSIGGMLVDPRFIPRHALHLIGVCVGTQEAETVAFAYSEVVDGSTRFSEKKSKIELYGLAHDLLPLADWAPSCLDGTKLAAAISPS